MFLISSICIAQQNTFNKETELQKFIEQGGKVEETVPDTYKLTYRDGTQRAINFSRSEKLNNNLGDFNTTIINVWEIDTTLDANKFLFWQKVGIVNDFEGLVFVDDININGLLELYGLTQVNFPFGGQVEVLEQDIHGIFHSVHSYDSTSLFVQGIGDVDSDGRKEVHIRATDTLNGKFYKSDSLGALPTTFDFIFYYTPNQIQDMNFGDFDKNYVTDCAFVDGSNPSKVIISEFKDTLNNFTTLFEYPTEGDIPSGLSIGDFDLDGKTELTFGTVLQNAYVIEASSTNQYSVVWQGLAPTYNAYMITKTMDIDGNGKPEFWIGGQDFNEGTSTFWCYEADGDNNYVRVAAIELRYLVSLYTNYLQASDIDNNGKEELIINIGNYLLVLKFTGESNQHNYEIYYAKIGELTEPSANFQPATVYDLNRDGRKDILIPMDKYVNPNTIVFSYILVQDSITYVDEKILANDNNYFLRPNYPNPFNPSTKITYNIPQRSNVSLKIYDVLGKEIATLVNEQKEAGLYEIKYDASKLSSGVYIYSIQAGDFLESRKMILMK